MCNWQYGIYHKIIHSKFLANVYMWAALVVLELHVEKKGLCDIANQFRPRQAAGFLRSGRRNPVDVDES